MVLQAESPHINVVHAFLSQYISVCSLRAGHNLMINTIQVDYMTSHVVMTHCINLVVLSTWWALIDIKRVSGVLFKVYQLKLGLLV